jgi:hypothetical protein
MPSDERRRRLELERETDELKAQVLVIWGRLRHISEDLSELRDNENERKSQNALPPYRDELPSETQISLRPTGARFLFKNGRPSTVLVALIVLGVVAMVWLLRPR